MSETQEFTSFQIIPFIDLLKDHSFVQKLVDAGQIDENEAENHPRKNELTRALGISDTVQVEVTPNPILTKKGDKFY